MGPISAIAISFFLAILGLTWIAAITASIHVLGILALIATVIILLDTFWLYGRHYGAR